MYGLGNLAIRKAVVSKDEYCSVTFAKGPKSRPDNPLLLLVGDLGFWQRPNAPPPMAPGLRSKRVSVRRLATLSAQHVEANPGRYSIQPWPKAIVCESWRAPVEAQEHLLSSIICLITDQSVQQGVYATIVSIEKQIKGPGIPLA